MRYPLNQSESTVPETLRALLDPAGVWTMTNNVPPYRYRFARADGQQFEWDEDALNSLDTRIAPIVRKEVIQFSGSGKAAQRLAQNILCWYQAVTLDLPSERERYYLWTIKSIESDDERPWRAKMLAQAFMSMYSETDAYHQQIPREEQSVRSFNTIWLFPRWEDLEAQWPGLTDKKAFAEQLGLSNTEMAQLLFNDIPAVTPSTALPCDIVNN